MCHQWLVAESVLSEGEVNNPRDLAEVANVVFQKTTSQRELVARFPLDEFKTAEPNDGYLIMAALFREGALKDTMTLNFDLAACNALKTLDARQEVSTIRGPDDFDQLSARNLIYLHRDINSPPDDIILRAEQMKEAWQGNWEEVVAQRVLTVPIAVFVGLGSSADVLSETTKRIRNAVGTDQARIFLVDPAPHSQSVFAKELDISCDNYLSMGWGEFMRALAEQVVVQHCAEVKSTCDILVKELGIGMEDVAELCGRLAEVGLVALGKLRSKWMLESGSYLPHQRGNSLRLFSDLILAVRMVERLSNTQVRFDGVDGLVEFSRNGYRTRVLACSGGGWMSYALVKAKLQTRWEEIQRQGRVPSVALVAGVVPGSPIVTPDDIATDTDPDNLITGPSYLQVVNVSELRDNARLAYEVVR